MNAVIRPRAQDDILRQFRWYLIEQDAPDAAFRFVEAVEVERLVGPCGPPRLMKNLDRNRAVTGRERKSPVPFSTGSSTERQENSGTRA